MQTRTSPIPLVGLVALWRALHEEPEKEYTYVVEALTGVYYGAATSSPDKDLIGHILHGSPTKLYKMRRSSTRIGLKVAALTYQPYQF